MTAPRQYKIDVLKDNFYKELEKVFKQFPRYWTNILLRAFNAKPKKDNIFTRNIWSVSLHEYKKTFFVKSSKIYHIKI
jgi:hypothetical protein